MKSQGITTKKNDSDLGSSDFSKQMRKMENRIVGKLGVLMVVCIVIFMVLVNH